MTGIAKGTHDARTGETSYRIGGWVTERLLRHDPLVRVQLDEAVPVTGGTLETVVASVRHGHDVPAVADRVVVEVRVSDHAIAAIAIVPALDCP